MRSPTQRERLLIGSLYLATLFALGIWAHQGWPPLSGSGAWFYAAGIALLLSVFVAEPFYTSPAAALGNSAGLVLVALLADLDGLEAGGTTVSVGRWALVVVGTFVLLCAGVSIATFRRDSPSQTNRVTRLIATRFGSGYFLYGLAYVAGVYGAFASEPRRLAVLYIALLAFMARPLERFFTIWPEQLRSQTGPEQITVTAVHDPGLATLKAPRATLNVGDRVTAAEAEGVILDITQSEDQQWALASFPPTAVPSIGVGITRAPGDVEEVEGEVLGPAVRGTTLTELTVFASATGGTESLDEGHLLQVPIRERTILYQVTGARIENVPLGEADHSVFRVTAQKLGSWDDAESRFDLVEWLPTPGAIVRLVRRIDAHFNPEYVGVVPGSRYGLRYEPSFGVTHNTAVLGVLGSGKTTLAQELICRNLARSIKVLILDITRQHSLFFDSLVPASEMDERHAGADERLMPWHERRERDAEGFFGSEGEFRRLLHEDIAEFLDGCDMLRIYNPLLFTVTTLEGFARAGRAEDFRELSTVEKTSIIAQALLKASAERGETADPRICIVLEEGHSLVPEPSEGLVRGEQHAVASAARAVLQGRKYGFGCLLVTQRTANVTKTILNQCHTVFALRSYDATGMAFLANYFGETYSKVISSIPKFHAVAFGEGVNCIMPVIVRLNDPEEFRARVWKPESHLIRERVQECRAQHAGDEQRAEQRDDIPF